MMYRSALTVFFLTVLGTASAQTPPPMSDKEKDDIDIRWRLVEDEIRTDNFEQALLVMRTKKPELPRTTTRHRYFYGTALFRVTAPQLLQILRAGDAVQVEQVKVFEGLLKDLKEAQDELNQAKDRLDKDTEINQALFKSSQATLKLAEALQAEVNLARGSILLAAKQTTTQLNLGKDKDAQIAKDKQIADAVEKALETNTTLKKIVLDPLKKVKENIDENDGKIKEAETAIAKFYTTVKDFLRAANFVKAEVDRVVFMLDKENKSEVRKLDEKVADLQARVSKFPTNPAEWERKNPPAVMEPYPALEMLKHLVTAVERIKASEDTAKAVIKKSQQAVPRPPLGQRLLDFWAEVSTLEELRLRDEHLQQLQKSLRQKMPPEGK